MTSVVLDGEMCFFHLDRSHSHGIVALALLSSGFGPLVSNGCV